MTPTSIGVTPGALCDAPDRQYLILKDGARVAPPAVI